MTITLISYNDEIEYEISKINDKFYYKISTEILHRLDGPAVEFANGTKYWYQNGKFHRIDGPAIEWSNGGKEYYINGKHVNFSGTDEEWIIKNLLE